MSATDTDTQVDDDQPRPQDAQGSQESQVEAPTTTTTEPAPKRRRIDDHSRVKVSLDGLPPGSYMVDVVKHTSGCFKVMTALRRTASGQVDPEAAAFVAHVPIGHEQQRCDAKNQQHA